MASKKLDKHQREVWNELAKIEEEYGKNLSRTMNGTKFALHACGEMSTQIKAAGGTLTPLQMEAAALAHRLYREDRGY